MPKHHYDKNGHHSTEFALHQPNWRCSAIPDGSNVLPAQSDSQRYYEYRWFTEGITAICLQKLIAKHANAWGNTSAVKHRDDFVRGPECVCHIPKIDECSEIAIALGQHGCSRAIGNNCHFEALLKEFSHVAFGA